MALHSETTNSLTNISAMHKLQQQLERGGVNRCLPCLDSVIESIVDDEEDGAPLGEILNLAEVVGPIDDDSDSEEAPNADAVFSVVEVALYADWSTRDALLQ